MIQISALLGNGQKLDGGSMFGNAPRPVWEKWIAPDELGRIPLACRALLIEYNSYKILCETGIGAFFDPKMAERFGVQNSERHLLIENLKNIGIDAKDITHVVLSHLHFDHAGGLLPSFQDMANGHSGLAFPNATIITSRTAFDRGMKPHARDRASFIPELMKRLPSASLELIDDPKTQTLFDGRMSFYTSDGHTPGQLHTVFRGKNESVIFCADLIPGRPWVHSAITMGYDRFPELLIDEKEALYKKMDLEKTNFFFTHDSEVAMSKVQKDERGKYSSCNEVAMPLRYEL
jgi:glyoxylase-like metal-dependent hydrolase (beta-lactamase superfamily II)